MKNVFSVLFLVVFGLAVSALAKELGKVTQAHLEALEQELEDAALLTEDISDEDDSDESDDSDEDDEEINARWNPITWMSNNIKNKCVCENDSCNCCVKVKILDKKACLSAEKLNDEQKINVAFSLDEKSLVQRKFSVNRTDNICAPVPVPALSFLQYCFTQDSKMDDEGVISSCSSVTFKIAGKTGAVLQFTCLEIKDGQITVGGYREADKSAAFTLKVKNPFKAAMDLYTNATRTE